MQKKKSGRLLGKAMALAMTMGTCCILLPGCGDDMQTQEELVTSREQRDGQGETITGEGEAAMVAASGSVAEQVQAPEVYRNEISSDEIIVNIDAKLVIPDVEGIKTKKVTSRVFTQEDYDHVKQTLLGEGKLWDRDFEAMEATYGASVQDIDRQIAYLENARDVEGIDGDKPYADKEETLNEQIAQAYAMKETAEQAGFYEPVIKEIPEVISYDEARVMAENADESNWLVGYVTKDGTDYLVALDNNLGKEWQMIRFTIERNDSRSFSYIFDTEANAEKIAALNIRQEELSAKTQELLQQMGLEEYGAGGYEYFYDYVVAENDMAVPDKYFYGAHIVRVVDGVPITYTHQNGGGEDVAAIPDNMQYVMWPYEEMTLIYDEGNVISFEWSNPYEIEELSSEYVFLMPFSDIQNIFEEMVMKKLTDDFTGVAESVEIDIEEVRLGYMRIREPDSGEGTLVPVWDFFGTRVYKDENGKQLYTNDNAFDSIMTINAMDGTVISRDFGY